MTVKLSVSQLFKRDEYVRTFYEKIMSGTPIPLLNGETVIISPSSRPIQILSTSTWAASRSKFEDEVLYKGKYTSSFVTTGRNIALNEISKEAVKTRSRIIDGTTTTQQENTSLYCFQYFQDHGVFPPIEDLRSIFPGIDTSWINSFQLQTREFDSFVKKHNVGPFKEFNRTGSFMDWISRKVSSLGVSKNTWSPVDIWLLKNPWERDSDIYNLLDDCHTINELNFQLRGMFESGDIVGVSLKKIGRTAHGYALKNTSYNPTNKSFIYNTGFLNFKLKGEYFESNESTLVGLEGHKIQCKSNSNGTNTVEVSMRGASAMIGKVPRTLLTTFIQQTLPQYQLPSRDSCPQTYEEFILSLDKFRNYVIMIKEFGIIETSIEDFDSSMKTILSNPSLETLKKLNSKFQAIEFSYLISSLCIRGVSIDDIFSTLIGFGEKEGDSFCPFLKIF